tara:strand:+ start:651 stop:1055 length:405 start_codon:yes stop_codon:yes gene_type:complete
MYAVQTLTELNGWLNVWGVTGRDNVRLPCMFETEAEAEAEMVEAVKDDPSLTLRVIKLSCYRIDINISQHWDQEYWAEDEYWATKMAEEEAGNPAKYGWRWNDGQYEIQEVTRIPDEKFDLSCEEPEVLHTATV